MAAWRKQQRVALQRKWHHGAWRTVCAICAVYISWRAWRRIEKKKAASRVGINGAKSLNRWRQRKSKSIG